VIPNLPENARWIDSGVTVAGGNGSGSSSSRFDEPYGFYVDDDQTLYIADYGNHRVMQWKKGSQYGRVVAGGNGKGSRPDQLYNPTDVVFDKETNSVIICDRTNERIQQWSLLSDTTQGETLISNIDCWGLAMDNQRYLYVSVHMPSQVRRYRIGETNGTIVAGGGTRGSNLDQLAWPYYLFVDQALNVYVSDGGNHRVVKWSQGAKAGIVVAGGYESGNALIQLSGPRGIAIDTLDNLYVSDSDNHRIMRWFKGAKKSAIVLGGNDFGVSPRQLYRPQDISFDRRGNLYVVDRQNHRIQQFTLQQNQDNQTNFLFRSFK
ncbi:unnamed protein product, partial [Rotaria sp. Silwood1]